MDEWHVENLVIKSCGVCDDREQIIQIPSEIDQKLKMLVKNIDTEWLLYLKYNKEENDKKVTYTVTDIVIPDQTVSGTSVTDIQPIEGDVGVIHAHQFTSSKFFSKTDQDYVNSNNAFSLTINGTGEYLGVVRTKTQCNRYVILDAKVEIVQNVDKEFLDNVKSHLKKREYEYVYRNYYEPRYVSPKENCPLKDQSKCMEDSYFSCPYFSNTCPKKDKPSVYECNYFYGVDGIVW